MKTTHAAKGFADLIEKITEAVPQIGATKVEIEFYINKATPIGGPTGTEIEITLYLDGGSVNTIDRDLDAIVEDVCRKVRV